MSSGVKSPDPPDGLVSQDMIPDGDPGDDSQESSTLRNALQPLPDTQPDTQSRTSALENHSSEKHGSISVPLLSRPKELAISQPDITFKYAQPTKITPGQFNRSKSSKMINLVMESALTEDSSIPSGVISEKKTVPGSVDTEAMFIPARHKRSPNLNEQQPPQAGTSTALEVSPSEQPPVQRSRIQAMDEIPTQPGLGHVPKKKPPFEDYQPTYLPLDHENQLYTPATVPKISQGQDVASRSDKPHSAIVPKNNPQHLMYQGTVQILQQKPRTSFQNDTSVSSAYPPRQVPPLTSPSIGMMNRPLRDREGRSSKLNTPSSRPQSVSVIGSNTKRKRASHTSVVSSSLRATNGHALLEQAETPSLRRRRWSPQDQLKRQLVQKLNTHMGDVAGCINDKFVDITAEMDKQFQTITDLKYIVKQQRDEMSWYKNQTQSKESVIQQLEENKDQLAVKLQKTEQELQERSTKYSKLEEKCRGYKEYLNKAIVEQQDLYKATKAKCDGAISLMQAEESKRKILQERERKHAEAAREHLNQVVKTTIAAHKQQNGELNNKIESLNQIIQERDADILRERETSGVLLLQNTSITSIQDTLQNFGTQIEGIVSKVNEIVSHQNHQDDVKAGEMHTKIDQIVGQLRALDERVYSKDAVSKELQELNNRAVSSLLGKLEPILDSQLENRASLESLSSGLREYIDHLWAALQDREDILEENVEQRQAENEKHIDMLHQKLQSKEQECAQQSQLLFYSEAAVRDRQSAIDKLQAEISELEQTQANSVAQSELMESLRKDQAKLKEDAAGKAAQVSELQTRLQESRVAIEAEGKKHQRVTEELQKLIDQKVVEAQAAQVQAVEAAQRDALLKMNQVKADIDERLSQALEERGTLQRELDEAKEKISTMRYEFSSNSAKINHLEKELETSETKTTKVREDMDQKIEEHQKSREHQLKVIEDLQCQLANTNKKFSNLAENAQAYDKAAKLVLQSLVQWTQDYAEVRQIVSELANNKNGVMSEEIDPRFQPLIQIQLLQKAVIQYCQAQKQAAETLSGGPDSVKARPPAAASLNFAPKATMDSILDRIRRVMIRSPSRNAPSPRPPSVQTEQERRRTADPPKSIMKYASNFQQQEAEDQPSSGLSIRRHSIHSDSRDAHQQGKPKESVEGSTMNRSVVLNRGPYNRLVAGSNARFEKSTTENVSPQNDILDDDGTTEREAMPKEDSKRKALTTQEPETSRKRARITTTKKPHLSTPHTSPPESNAANGSDFEHIPHAPRKTGQRSIVGDEQPSSPIRSSQLSQDNSQRHTVTVTSGSVQSGIRHRSMEGRMPFVRGISLNGSQDPLALFHQRRRSTSTRGNEDSQDSTAQDVEAQDQALLSMSRRFTMGR